MAFPVDSLIVALVAGTSSGLGVSWLNNHYENRRATQASADARAGRQRDAYAALVVAARLALRNLMQLRVLYSRPGSNLPDDPMIRNILTATDSIASDLGQAAVIVELMGSDAARTHARAISEAAKDAGDLYQERSHRLATPSRSELARAIKEVFDSAEAGARCTALREAIDAFTEALRPELTRT